MKTNSSRLKSLSLAAGLSLATFVGYTLPAAADSLENRHPSGCFATVARDWNSHAPDDLFAFSAFSDRFQRCAGRDKDEVQVRSDLVGWYKSELGLTVNYLKANQPRIAKRHYDRCYAILDLMVSLAQKSGDVSLGRYVTESSRDLYEASGMFEADATDGGGVSEQQP
jgi:hypothetical protein